MVLESFPFDKYEMEASPLTQYILERRQANVAWQVHVIKAQNKILQGLKWRDELLEYGKASLNHDDLWVISQSKKNTCIFLHS